jgi:hypothetical protein
VIRTLTGWLAWIVLVCASSARLFGYLDTRAASAIIVAAVVINLSTLERTTNGKARDAVRFPGEQAGREASPHDLERHRRTRPPNR